MVCSPGGLGELKDTVCNTQENALMIRGTKNNDNHKVYLDSGASSHIFGDSSKFQTGSIYKTGGIVTVADGRGHARRLVVVRVRRPWEARLDGHGAPDRLCTMHGRVSSHLSALSARP